MRTFSDIINEAKKDNIEVSSVDFNAYLDKLKGDIPNGMAIAMNLLIDYGVNTTDKVEALLKANKSQLNKLSDEYQVSASELEELRDLLKTNKAYLRILPMYHSEVAIKAVQNGTLKADDLMIDMSTSRGKNEVAKKYMGVVYHIVNQMSGKSNLSHSDLMSAALEIFANKMEKWSPDGNKDGKVVSFKTYIAYIIKFELANEMGKYGHTLSGTSTEAWKKRGAAALDAISLDHLGRNLDGEFNQDHLAALGVDDEMEPEEKVTWEDLYKELEKKFSQRDCDIFYSYFGLNGHKKEKNKEIAKRYGVTNGATSQLIKKIVTFLQKDPKSVKVLHELANLYNESLMITMWQMDREAIMEQLVNDDVFILLESVAPWKNKAAFQVAYNNALGKVSDPNLIDEIINGDYNTIDDHIKSGKDDIAAFISAMYPTLKTNKITDLGLIDKMAEIQKFHKQYK